MNRTRIEWTDFTWNPLVGCLHGCRYCYARRQARRQLHRCEACARFEPHLHPERLEEPAHVRTTARIFCCSMGELFGPWVDPSWTRLVLETAGKCPRHTFQFLTKSPHRLAEFEFPENCWVGTSIESDASLWRKEALLRARARVRFVSFEPLLGPMPGLSLDGLGWVIIGAETGPRKVSAERSWVQGIIDAARAASVPVFVKNNVHWHEPLREWPEAIEERRTSNE